MTLSIRHIPETEAPPVAEADWHGSLTAYTDYGCRCDSCRAAASDWFRAYRKRIKAEVAASGELPPYVSHGTIGAYTNYACRCAKCRAAATAQKASEQFRRASK